MSRNCILRFENIRNNKEGEGGIDQKKGGGGHKKISDSDHRKFYTLKWTQEIRFYVIEDRVNCDL